MKIKRYHLAATIVFGLALLYWASAIVYGVVKFIFFDTSSLSGMEFFDALGFLFISCVGAAGSFSSLLLILFHGFQIKPVQTGRGTRILKRVTFALILAENFLFYALFLVNHFKRYLFRFYRACIYSALSLWLLLVPAAIVLLSVTSTLIILQKRKAAPPAETPAAPAEPTPEKEDS